MAAAKPLRVVFLADLHVGSRTGLAIAGEEPHDDVGHPIRAALYDAYREKARNSEWHRPDALVVAGDAVEGQGRKGAGVDCWTTRYEDQRDMAVELLKMWRADKIYVIGGSKYHVQAGDTGFGIEELIGRELGAEAWPNQGHIKPERRQRSGPHWFLTFEGVTVHVAHHVAISRVFHYKGTPISRELLAAGLNDPMRRMWEEQYKARTDHNQAPAQLVEELRAFKTSVVVRAHCHYFWLVDAGGTMGMTLPCWKTADPFIMERDSLGYSHIGFVGMTFKGGAFAYQKNLFRPESIAPCPHTIVRRGRGGAEATGD